MRGWVRAFICQLLLVKVALPRYRFQAVRYVGICCNFSNFFKDLRRIYFDVALGIVRTQEHRKDLHDASIERQFLPI